MARVVVAMYDRLEDAHQAIQALDARGFDRGSISLVVGDEQQAYVRHLDQGEGTEQNLADGAAAGAGIGAAIGGLGGLLIGLGALTLPVIGPVLAAGPLAGALIGAAGGALTGGLIGALVDAGIPEEYAHKYSEGVRHGGALVLVRTSNEDAERAVDTLNEFNPVDLERRSAEWEDQARTGLPQEVGLERPQQIVPPEKPYGSDQPVQRRPELHDEEHDRVMPSDEQVNAERAESEFGSPGVRDSELEVRQRGGRTASETDFSAGNTNTPNLSDTDRDPGNQVDVEDRTIPSEQGVMRGGGTEVPVQWTRAQDEVTDLPESEYSALGQEESFDEPGQQEIEEFRQGTAEIEARKREIGMQSGPHPQSSQEVDVDTFEVYEPMFRNHYDTSTTMGPEDFEYYRPAYRFGYDLGNDPRNEKLGWAEVEPEARRRWQQDHPDSAWEDFKEAIEKAWYEVTARH